MNAYHHAVLIKHSPVNQLDIKSVDFGDEIQDTYFERFGIDDARRLVATANNLPANEDVQTLVVRADFVTLEAQNALLKILEEPPETTRLVFVLPEGFQVLPTLLSRFSIITTSGTDTKNATEEFRLFQSQVYAERLRAVEVSTKKKDLAWQQAIKQGLLIHLLQEKSDCLAELEYVASHLLTRGASNKFLLEHLSLTLPIR